MGVNIQYYLPQHVPVAVSVEMAAKSMGVHASAKLFDSGGVHVNVEGLQYQSDSGSVMPSYVRASFTDIHAQGRSVHVHWLRDSGRVGAAYLNPSANIAWTAVALRWYALLGAPVNLTDYSDSTYLPPCQALIDPKVWSLEQNSNIDFDVKEYLGLSMPALSISEVLIGTSLAASGSSINAQMQQAAIDSGLSRWLWRTPIAAQPKSTQEHTQDQRAPATSTGAPEQSEPATGKNKRAKQKSTISTLVQSQVEQVVQDKKPSVPNKGSSANTSTGTDALAHYLGLQSDAPIGEQEAQALAHWRTQIEGWFDREKAADVSVSMQLLTLHYISAGALALRQVPDVLSAQGVPQVVLLAPAIKVDAFVQSPKRYTNSSSVQNSSCENVFDQTVFANACSHLMEQVNSNSAKNCAQEYMLLTTLQQCKKAFERLDVQEQVQVFMDRLQALVKQNPNALVVDATYVRQLYEWYLTDDPKSDAVGVKKGFEYYVSSGAKDPKDAWFKQLNKMIKTNSGLDTAWLQEHLKTVSDPLQDPLVHYHVHERLGHWFAQQQHVRQYYEKALATSASIQQKKNEDKSNGIDEWEQTMRTVDTAPLDPEKTLYQQLTHNPGQIVAHLQAQCAQNVHAFEAALPAHERKQWDSIRKKGIVEAQNRQYVDGDAWIQHLGKLREDALDGVRNAALLSTLNLRLISHIDTLVPSVMHAWVSPVVQCMQKIQPQALPMLGGTAAQAQINDPAACTHKDGSVIANKRLKKGHTVK